ncbi:MAG: hypothetical protein C0486_04995 [Erythrobacter sp.]|nr:hypothetical protein [Erythrobacter sp.]MBA4079821.1 hypothetical protein [Erythrobacter sp.]
MTKFVRRQSYIRIEEQEEEVWIFEDELPADRAITQIEAEPDFENAPRTQARASTGKRILMFTLSTAIAVASGVAASAIYSGITS